MTEPAGAYGNVLANAWEISADDRLGEHPVANATDDGTTVTVVFGDGTPDRALPRNSEVTLSRWFQAPVADPEAAS